MKHLDKKRVQEIAMEYGIKTIPFAKFLSRMQNTPQSEVLAVFKEYSESKQTTKRGILAAELAIAEMEGSLKKPKKKKNGASSTKKKKTSSKVDSEDKATKTSSARISNYNYPDEATSEEKKKFRAKARGEAKKWAKTLGEEDGSDNKEYQKWHKETYGAI